jgi:hypothetical protein
MNKNNNQGNSTGGGGMFKYDFSVRTRGGQKIDSIVIMGRDRADAERKLYQMYRQCEILRCELRQPGEKNRRAA